MSPAFAISSFDTVLLILTGLFCTGLILLFIYAASYESLRRLSLKNAAKSLGFRFEETVLGIFLADFICFELFRKGEDGEACNLLQGNAHGRKWQCFDYSYIGKDRFKYSCSVISIKEKKLHLPRFLLIPQTFLGVSPDDTAMKLNKISLPDHPDLTKNFDLYAEDEKQSASIFTNELIRYLSDKGPDLPNIEASGDTIIFYPDIFHGKHERVKVSRFVETGRDYISKEIRMKFRGENMGEIVGILKEVTDKFEGQVKKGSIQG